MKQVNDDADTLIVITTDIEDTVVVLSKRDYDSMQETLRVLSNDYVMNNKQFSEGNFATHELIKTKLDD